MSDWKACLSQHLSAYYADITTDEISLWTAVIAAQSGIFRQTLYQYSLSKFFPAVQYQAFQQYCRAADFSNHSKTFP